MNIFEQLDLLLIESEKKSIVKESEIPIHPERETKEQGKIAAAEEYLKIFQNTKGGGSGGPGGGPGGPEKEEVIDSAPPLPDSVIDPKVKETSKTPEKTFEKNKLVGKDDIFKDKHKKEIEKKGGDDDDFLDDFDYRDNKFGDDDDDFPEGSDGEGPEGTPGGGKGPDGPEGTPGGGRKGGGRKGPDGPDGDDPDGDDPDGPEGTPGGGKGPEIPKGGGHKGPKGGGHKGPDGGGPEGEGFEKLKNAIKDGLDRISEIRNSGRDDDKDPSTHSKKPNKIDNSDLKTLKDSIDSDDESIEDVREKINDIKNPKPKETPGERMDKTPSDDDFRKDMKKAGFDDETIDKMIGEKNKREHYSEAEMKKMATDIKDSLLSDAEEKGKVSALATSIVKHSLSQSIQDGEWRGKLEDFLKKKSDLNKGDLSSSYDGVGFDSRRNIARGMVLPKIDVKSNNSTIKNIYCFIDFSGSCEKKLVFTFLGKVINLTSVLKYTNIYVYGFANNLTPPMVLNKSELKKVDEDVLNEMWSNIGGHISGGAIENFLDVAMEIRDIRKKEKDAIILLFGDGKWPEYIQGDYKSITFKYKSKNGTVGPLCLKDVLDNSFLKNNICALLYYEERYRGEKEMCEFNTSVLRNIVGIKNIIALPSKEIDKI